MLTFIFYALCASLLLGDVALQRVELALAQKRYARAYHLARDYQPMTAESALLTLEAGVLADRDTEFLSATLAALSEEDEVARRDFWLAIRELKKGELGNALAEFNRLYALKDFPYRKVVRRNIARIHLELENADEALRVIDKGAEKLAPEDQYLYAEALLALGRYREVQELYPEAGQGAVQSFRRQTLVAESYYGAGDIESAIEVLEQLNPSAGTRDGRQALSFLSLMRVESGTAQRDYEVMLSVLKQTTVKEPYQDYLDQTLLAAEALKTPRAQLQSDLAAIKWAPQMQPHLFYALAQLQDKAEAKIRVLAKIYQNYPDDIMASKASYLAAQLANQLEDADVREQLLKEIAAQTTNLSLRAKIYSWVAEEQAGAEKLQSYEQAMESSDITQYSKLRLNYNLAEFYLPRSERMEYVLSSDEYPDFQYELAQTLMDEDPTEATQLLRDFIRSEPKDSRLQVAHLSLAELLLQKRDVKLVNAIRGHLETVGDVDNEKVDRARLHNARLRLALLAGNQLEVERLVRETPRDKAFLLKGGKQLYEQREPYLASLLFKKAERIVEQPVEQRLASFYLALCYLDLSTQAHVKNALSRLRALSETPSDEPGGEILQTEAQLLLAQFYLDQAMPEDALKLLTEMPTTSKVLLMQARSYGLMRDAGAEERALKAYNKLYQDDQLPAEVRYEIVDQYTQYLKRIERHGRELELYYQVANFETLPEPTSTAAWQRYRVICNRALTLLEKQGQWRSAYNLAKLVSQSNSPDRDTFAQKARELSLKNILWDDE